jgi:hypothetical protein
MAKEIPVLVPQMVDVNVTLTCVVSTTKLGRTVNVRLNLMKIVKGALYVHQYVQKDIHAKKTTPMPTLLVCLLIEWW